MKKEKKTPKRFFENPRLEITRILIDELQDWESTTTPSMEEMLRLVDKLAGIICLKRKRSAIKLDKRV